MNDKNILDNDVSVNNSPFTIHHLPLKKGYKQTEVGLIAHDWKVFPLKSLLVENPKYGIGAAAIEFNYDSYTYLRITDIDESGRIIESGLKSVEHAECENYILDEGELVFARTGASVGKSYLYNKADGVLVYAGFLIKVKPDIRLLDPNYLKDFVKTKTYWNWVTVNSMRSGQPGINSNELGSLLIPLPPTLTEQKAIATALSDVDDLIANLDKLISKKKAIKQGAMQQLLTPNEKWVNTSLIELAENKKTQFDDGDWIESEYIISQGVRLIQTGNIGIGVFKDKGNKKYISEESFNKLNCKEVLKGDLLICRLAEPAGRACVMPSIGEDKVVTSVDVSIFRGNQEVVNREFLSQLFTTNGWFQKVIEKVGGTTHKRISRGALGKINIEVPIIEEQKRIALVLSDMDAEIEQLETKKEKYQAIKQGMMQELLTGKTRLV